MSDSSKVAWSGSVRKPVNTPIDVELTQNDIFNWLTECENKNTLLFLGRYALLCAKEKTHDRDGDDFRSRA